MHIYRKAAATRPAAAAAISKPALMRPAAAVTWRAAELVVFEPVTVPTEAAVVAALVRVETAAAEVVQTVVTG